MGVCGECGTQLMNFRPTIYNSDGYNSVTVGPKMTYCPKCNVERKPAPPPASLRAEEEK